MVATLIRYLLSLHAQLKHLCSWGLIFSYSGSMLSAVNKLELSEVLTTFINIELPYDSILKFYESNLKNM